MKHKINTLITRLIDCSELSGLHITMKFNAGEDDDAVIARNLNAAFLISLAGPSHPSYSAASQYLNDFESRASWSTTVQFYKEGVRLIHNELSYRYDTDTEFAEKIDDLCSQTGISGDGNYKHVTDSIHGIFFPEGTGLSENRNEAIEMLRKKRRVRITRLNDSPITDPAADVLITSNILVTIPPLSREIESTRLSSHLKQTLQQILLEEQLYWYDHPVPVGIPTEQNEVLYGLEGLDRAVAFEKKRGVIDKDAKVTCVLSVSVTHKGLQQIVKSYLEDEFRKEKSIQHLDVFVFTEADTQKLITDILVPLAKELPGSDNHETLYEIFGVDGEYGRHYSFLKAIAAFWQVFINPGIKGTFKIDLDQVFPQKELVEQSGMSAFEHFKTSLWGAEGIDGNGSRVEMGMIAGALVNEKDIAESLYTPDVRFPADKINPDELIFFSVLPQALSTEAEMMTRYTGSELDGTHHCIQRIHVTGGTNGILIDALRKYRPFTPTFIGRAEDQAYILSVLFDGDQGMLRYAHKAGLIMRHDKEAFADEVIKISAAGKLVGDYVRTLMFSYYVNALPWSFDEIKKEIDPFTGCFVSKIPVTVVYLRFAMKSADLFSNGPQGTYEQGLDFFHVGTRRLHETIQTLTVGPNPLIAQFKKEKKGWDLFYNILESAEKDIENESGISTALREKARSMVQSCKINFISNPDKGNTT